ncbi:RNA polymerase primary sigma factor/RNA polymerase nonessential primary-like sigma factor [Kribbella voronezhensis]|uniref:RNA polymerase primary sigma factor/RNA polymerase nonessential primary-like sigma factor n=1 Tax=Kribbella voronezhensis TaxID=2512212 RepID=A0A4R7T7X4_9ACTN|nr:sigma-70 family RNA polymerase sigma factor [Kribbella voronezhensis]TDU87396.1 RNA polymerase primary sigma factor/RNA polymerase nonessential primary-like sigma factor [Kribbella voronezhensis]
MAELDCEPADVSALVAYLRDIGRHELLTLEEVRELSYWIEAGLLAADRLEGAAPADRADLLAVAELGRQARRRMIEGNLRLVVSLAKRYAGKGVSLLDLIQEGNLGLMRAIERFDHRRGHRFSTYAIWWIRQAIGRAVSDRSRLIRMPAQAYTDATRVAAVHRDLTQRLGREPTAAEVAAAACLTPARVERANAWKVRPDSLDVEETDLEIDDESIVLQAALRRDLNHQLDFLDDLGQTVLRLRFGLTGRPPTTLEETAEQLGLTPEQTSTLERDALRALRRRCRRTLRDYAA